MCGPPRSRTVSFGGLLSRRPPGPGPPCRDYKRAHCAHFQGPVPCPSCCRAFCSWPFYWAAGAASLRPVQGNKTRALRAFLGTLAAPSGLDRGRAGGVSFGGLLPGRGVARPCRAAQGPKTRALRAFLGYPLLAPGGRAAALCRDTERILRAFSGSPASRVFQGPWLVRSLRPVQGNKTCALRAVLERSARGTAHFRGAQCKTKFLFGAASRPPAGK